MAKKTAPWAKWNTEKEVQLVQLWRHRGCLFSVSRHALIGLIRKRTCASAHICFSTEVTFDHMGIHEISCLWDLHCGIFTTKCCVRDLASWIDVRSKDDTVFKPKSKATRSYPAHVQQNSTKWSQWKILSLSCTVTFYVCVHGCRHACAGAGGALACYRSNW